MLVLLLVLLLVVLVLVLVLVWPALEQEATGLYAVTSCFQLLGLPSTQDHVVHREVRPVGGRSRVPEGPIDGSWGACSRLMRIPFLVAPLHDEEDDSQQLRV